MMLTRSQADNVSQALKFERHLKIYPEAKTSLALPTPNANMFWRCVFNSLTFGDVALGPELFVAIFVKVADFLRIRHD